MTQQLNSLKFVSHIQYVSPCLSTTGSDLQKNPCEYSTLTTTVNTLWAQQKQQTNCSPPHVNPSRRPFQLILVPQTLVCGGREFNLTTVKPPYCYNHRLHFSLETFPEAVSSGLKHVSFSLSKDKEHIMFSLLDLRYNKRLYRVAVFLIWQFCAIICLTYGLLG